MLCEILGINKKILVLKIYCAQYFLSNTTHNDIECCRLACFSSNTRITNHKRTKSVKIELICYRKKNYRLA